MTVVNWFLQTTLGHLLGMVITVGVGTVVTALKAREHPWSRPLMWGIGASALVLAMWASLAVLSSEAYYARRVAPQVTPENVRGKVEDWLLAFGASVERVPPSDVRDALFALRAKPRGSPRAILVQRPREMPHYLLINGVIRLGPGEMPLRQMLSQRQIQELDLELEAEMARAKIGYQKLESTKSLLDGLAIERRIPITADLTEDAFMQRFEEVHYDILVANSTIVLGLRRKTLEAKSPN